MSAPTTTLRRILDAEPSYDPRERGSLAHDHDIDKPMDFSIIAGRLGVEFAIWAMRTAPEYDAVWEKFAHGVALGAGIEADQHPAGAISAYRTAKAAVEKRARERMRDVHKGRRCVEYTCARDGERRRQWDILAELLGEQP